MTDDEIYDVFHEIVGTVTGLTSIIPANDNKPAPSGPYASIRVGAARGQRGHANQRRKNTDLVASPVGDVRDVEHDIIPQLTCDISLNFYRDGAGQYASMMYQANKRPDISALLFRNNIGWRNAGAINDLTALQSKEYEDRAQLTVTIWYEQTEVVTTNAIYTAQVAVENEDGDTIQTETINSPVGE
jgi:hypothetical protein